MARDLSASLEAAIIDPVVIGVFFFKAEFDSGDTLFWSGYGDLTWGGDTYTGVGQFGGIDKVDETSDVRANGATVTLSGIPSDLIALALTEPYQGRPCIVYLGALHLTTGALEGTPYPLLAGRMDVMSIEEGADTASISLTVENRLIELFRSKERRYTHEDQQIDFPGDLGLEYVAGLQEKPINWGVANPAAATQITGGRGNPGAHFGGGNDDAF